MYRSLHFSESFLHPLRNRLQRCWQAHELLHDLLVAARGLVPLLLQEVLKLALLLLVHLLVVEGLLVHKLLGRLSAIVLRVVH